MLNTSIVQEYATADIRITPTAWQREQFPGPLRDALRIVPDGIDTNWFAPDPTARFKLPNGRELRAGDAVVTYVARGADSYRGFDAFIRLIGALHEQKHDFDAVVLGDRTSYYGAGSGTGTFFESAIADVPFDRSRVHFLGRVPYKVHRRLLQVSSLHVFLSAPYVMSWSAMEALASGCLVLGWDAKPLTEFADDTSALLVPPGDETTLVRFALDALQNIERFELHRKVARTSITRTHDIKLHDAEHRKLLSSLGY
jgi:glycosyltransferase involved in cell wall biosynthesis